MPDPTPRPERNAAILAAHRRGEPLRAIAAEHGISFQRVAEIVAKLKSPPARETNRGAVSLHQPS